MTPVNSLNQVDFEKFVDGLIETLYASFEAAIKPVSIEPEAADHIKRINRERFLEKLRDPEKQLNDVREGYLLEKAILIGVRARNIAFENHAQSIDLTNIKTAINNVE